MTEDTRKRHTKKCGACGKQVTWVHGEKPEVCPLCNAIKWYKPADECVLFNLQKVYLETRDQDTLGQMYLKMQPYARKIINKNLGGCVRYDEDKLDDKVEASVETLIRYYIKRPSFYVTESFGYQLLKSAQQQLYNKKQKLQDKKEVSYDNPIKEGADGTYLDKLSNDLVDDDNKHSSELVDLSNKVYLLKELSQFVDATYNAIAKARGIDQAMLSMILFHHYMNKKNDSFFSDFYNHFGGELKETFELQKVVFYEYLEELNK